MPPREPLCVAARAPADQDAFGSARVFDLRRRLPCPPLPVNTHPLQSGKEALDKIMGYKPTPVAEAVKQLDGLL